ncbi:MAG: sigma-70 family RNA polymerase sigma factor [Gilvibacter sp.]
MYDASQFSQGFLDGDPVVLEVLYKRVFPNVLSYVQSHDGSKKDAEDIFQNALLVVFVKIKEEKTNIKAIDSYLFTVCRNLWRREAAKNRVTNIEKVTLWSKEIDLSAFYLEQEQFDLYREKFELLTEQCKELLGMSFAKVGYDAIVKAFNYASQLVARQRVFKCKNRLIELIKKDPRFIDLKQK